MKLDAYSFIARVFPALLSAISAFTLYFFFLKQTIESFLTALMGWQIVSDITVSFVLFFLLLQLSRLISKNVFEKIMFADRSLLPTTSYLMHLDAYFSPERTIQIHKKIRSDFNIRLASKNEENANPIDARRLAAEAVDQIRSRVGKGVLVGQHNAEYGFWRNLVGGAVIGQAFAIFDLYFFLKMMPNETAFWISAVLTILYSLTVVFSKQLIRSAGTAYARQLIQEYMAH
jgi:hypothetical protein